MLPLYTLIDYSVLSCNQATNKRMVNRMKIELHAQPYDTSASGFYFSTLEEYETKFELSQPVEEYELQFINGDDDQCQFAGMFPANSCDLEEWLDYLDQFEGLDDSEQVALFYLAEILNYSIDDCFNKYNDIMLSEGTALDAAYEHIEQCYNLDEMLGSLKGYFDYESYANDMERSSEYYEFRYNGTSYTVINASDV